MHSRALARLVFASAIAAAIGCGAGGPPPAGPGADAGADRADAQTGEARPGDEAASAVEQPSTIARADVTGLDLVQDDLRLYFAGPPLAGVDGDYRGPDGDLIWAVDKGGGHLSPLFENPAGPINGLARAGDDLFFSVGGSLVLSAEGDMASSKYRKGQIMRVAAGGGRPKVVAKNQVEPKSVAADGGQVFWFSDDDGSPGAAAVRRAATGGGRVKNVAQGAAAPGAVAVSGKHVLWLSTGEDPDAGWTTHLWLASRDGGKARKLATLEGEPRAVVSDGETAFVATAGIIAGVPLKGGDPARLVEDSRQPQAMAIDQERIYWTSREAGEVSSVPKRGGKIEVLARSQAEVGGIAVDDRAVYWTVKTAVRKLRKPGAAPEPDTAPAPAEPEEPADPFAPIAEEETSTEPEVELGPDPAKSDKIDPDELPEKWLKCKRDKQCVLIETGCCMLIAVSKKFRKQARKALPRSTCDAECSFENITARCEDKLCRAVITPK